VKIRETKKFYPELEWIEINGENDHIHALVSIPLKMNVSDIVRIVKCNTSNALKSKFDYLKTVYW
jgi:REP element-mobilizing transposase RayT